MKSHAKYTFGKVTIVWLSLMLFGLGWFCGSLLAYVASLHFEVSGVPRDLQWAFDSGFINDTGDLAGLMGLPLAFSVVLVILLILSVKLMDTRSDAFPDFRRLLVYLLIASVAVSPGWIGLLALSECNIRLPGSNDWIRITLVSMLGCLNWGLWYILAYKSPSHTGEIHPILAELMDLED